MNLEEKIASYRPSQQAVAAIQNTDIALLVGITGAGKDTIKHELLKHSDFHDIISYTTRAPRENGGILERDGVDYHFIDNEKAEQMIDNGEFIEVKFVHGIVYGTTIAEVLHAGESGTALTDVDVQGVAEYKAVSDQVVAIFVIPPSYNEWLRRLKLRYTTNAEFLREWPRRRESAIKELQRALELPYYHCVVNDDLHRAVTAATDIAKRPDRFTRKDDEARLAARELLQEIRMQA